MDIDRIPATSWVLRPQHLRDVNEAAVLRELVAHGPSSRLELATRVGLTRAPLTRIIGRLAERGLVRETNERVASGVRGRPRIPVELVPDAAVIVGAHIGLRKVALGTAGLDGTSHDVVGVDFDRTWAHAKELIVQHVRSVERQLPDRPILGVSVIVGGHVDPTQGLLDEHRSLGWRDVAIREELAAAVAHDVFVDSNARAHATADIIFGAVDGAQDFVHVFVGNFVEAAVVVGGKVRSGLAGRGGDVSSWTIPDEDGRSVEVGSTLTDGAIAERARQLGILDLDDVDLAVISALAGGKDGKAVRELLLRRAGRVGVLLAQIDALLAPELFVLSSGVLAVDGALEAASRALQAARPGLRVPELRSSPRGTNPLISSAAAIVLDRTVLDRGTLP